MILDLVQAFKKIKSSLHQFLTQKLQNITVLDDLLLLGSIGKQNPSKSLN